HDGPSAIRYPRGRVTQGTAYSTQHSDLKIGKAEIMADGDDIAIVAVGNTVYPALKAAEKLGENGVTACVINARFIKPLDEELIVSLAERTKRIITVEENVLAGGFGSAVLECISKAGLNEVQVRRIGIDDQFIEHGSQSILRKKYGLDEEGIYSACKDCLAPHPSLL
ncbi:MAG: transketolase C-terminal domain-containing protein, partial [Thermodesulfovibrionales bacterium]